MQARQQVKEMVWMKQSENMVLEAMAHLSAVHDALEEMLLGSHTSGLDQDAPAVASHHHLSSVPSAAAEHLGPPPAALYSVNGAA